MSNQELTFGGWLRQRRNELGVTQEELSNQLGFSLALLRKLESSERRPSGQIVYLLAEYFQVAADERDAFMTFARTEKIIATSANSSPTNPLAPWRGAYLHRTNLPIMLTPIIGRQQEKATALKHLSHPKTRLLTLTGAPGIGKTRLALEVAFGLVENFEDGVFFVDLAPVVDPELVIATIARTLGLKEAGDQSFEKVLLDYLRERRVLLFLDNFEQVLDAATTVVRLLEASPWLKVVITSREVLHVRGERRLSVLPLGLPDSKQVGSLEVLEAYPAVELFIERVRAIAPDFELNPENAADVIAVCTGLQGVPLAIELAAARARYLSIKELHAGLSNHLLLLTGGARDLPPRQRTLRAAIEWSYALLNDSEQRLFRYAGVFAGGFTAEASGWLNENQLDPTVSTFDLLLALTEKNLVRIERKSVNSADWRFGLLEAVREYAVEQLLKQGEMGEARREHAAYYSRLADRAEQHFTGTQYPEWGTDQISWVDRLETELGNMRLALDWYQSQVRTGTTLQSLKLENLEKGLRLATALRRIWLARGHFSEGAQWLKSFLSVVPQPLPIELSQLRATYAKAIAILGRLATLKGNVEAVRPLLEESLSIATELDDKQLIALILLISGTLALAQADYATARPFQMEALKLYRELGNKWGAAAVLQDLGDATLNQGNFSLARPMLEESLQLFREVGETFGIASVLVTLGDTAYFQGEHEEARALWQESLSIQRQISYSTMLGYLLVMLGWVALREGDQSAASALFKEGLQLGQTTATIAAVCWGLAGLATLASVQHQAERAALYFGAAEALGKARNVQLPTLKQAELDHEIALARTEVSDEIWNKAWARGYSIIIEATKISESPHGLGKALISLQEALEDQTIKV